MIQKYAFTTAAMAAALEDTPVSYEDLAEIEKDFDDAETEISMFSFPVLGQLLSCPSSSSSWRGPAKTRYQIRVSDRPNAPFADRDAIALSRTRNGQKGKSVSYVLCLFLMCACLLIVSLFVHLQSASR